MRPKNLEYIRVEKGAARFVFGSLLTTTGTFRIHPRVLWLAFGGFPPRAHLFGWFL